MVTAVTASLKLRLIATYGLGVWVGLTLWAALFGTLIGWVLLFPALFIGGMGQGDVKMQMGFGSWIGATFGKSGTRSQVRLS